MTEGPRILLTFGVALALCWYATRQCRKPAGWMGRFVLGDMNRRHADLTAWGLQHATVDRSHSILDVGCGGGRTIKRLLAAGASRVDGVDYSATSVAASRELNRAEVEAGRASVQVSSVSRLPFDEGTYDLVTAVETHYYWPNRTSDLREVLRVLKPGGCVLVIAEAYRGRSFDWLYGLSMKLLGGAYLSPGEHREWLIDAGCTGADVIVEASRGWICAIGRKPTGA